MVKDNGFDEKNSRNAAILQLLVSVPEINALKEKGKLLLRDLSGFLAVHRPGELIFLQAFQPQTETIPVPVNDFQDPPEFIAEQEQIALKGIHLQVFGYDDRKPVDLFAHVCWSWLHENPDRSNPESCQRFQSFHHFTEKVRIKTTENFDSVFACNNDL